MLRGRSASIVNVAVANDDVKILRESGGNNCQTNQRAFHYSIQKSRAADVDPKLFFRFFQQDRQLIFPKRRNGVAAMTARFVAQRNYDRASARHAFDLALKNSELGRIDQIV